MNIKKLILGTLCCTIAAGAAASEKTMTKQEVINIVEKVNDHWQKTHPASTWSFWHPAVYQTGNMAAYEVTKKDAYKQYALAWAEHNQWKGATSDNKTEWKFSYGEKPDYVLFGDWQCCFQTYCDLYTFDGSKDTGRIARAREVMEYEMSTPEQGYWWWADALYMVMPTMTKLYKATGKQQYLDKLYEYFSFAKNLMYDEKTGLFFRDGKYVYPKHKTPEGLKDFWARGNGWVFAALSKVLADLPKDDSHRAEYIAIYQKMAKSLTAYQQREGYWTRSIIDPVYVPGRETSGTALFTFGYLWGVNNGYLNKADYEQTINKAWNYLTKIALQKDGTVGFIQPIGERADQNPNVGPETTADFGVGAFLLAASEMSRYVK